MSRYTPEQERVVRALWDADHQYDIWRVEHPIAESTSDVLLWIADEGERIASVYVYPDGTFELTDDWGLVTDKVLDPGHFEQDEFDIWRLTT